MSKSGITLSKDEVIIRQMRTHLKKLAGPFLAEVLLLAAGVVATIFLPAELPTLVRIMVWLLVIVGSVPVFGMPWLRWITTTYTITSKRVITRAGILHRTGHDLPLSRVSDVSQDRSLIDRIFGCGTLTLQTSSDDPLVLTDVPKVGIVQTEMANLLFNDIQGAMDADPNE